MKQILFVVVLISSICGVSQAQNGRNNDTILPSLSILKEPRFLINVHTGYAMGLGSTFKFYPDDVRSITVIKTDNGDAQKSTSYSNPTKGLGDGFRFGGGFSYIVNDFINVGADLDYFSSTINKTRDSSYQETQITPVMGGPDEYYFNERKTTSYDATLITITPHITFKAISRPKWFLYNKLGAVITFRPNSLQEDVTTTNTRQSWQGFYKDSSSRTSTKYDWGIKKPAVGFMGAIGMQFKVAKQVRAFAELQFSHIVFVVRSRSLVELNVDGQEMKNSLPVSMREIRFVKSFRDDTSNNNPNQPSQTLIQRIPITYIGAQIGIAFQLR